MVLSKMKMKIIMKAKNKVMAKVLMRKKIISKKIKINENLIKKIYNYY